MLDYKSQFLNHLIQTRTEQFSKDLAKASLATIMSMTNAFQAQMKLLVEDRKVPAKYENHVAVIELAGTLLKEAAQIYPEIQRKKSEFSNQLKAYLTDYFKFKDLVEQSLPQAIKLDENNFEKISKEFSEIVTRFKELSAIIKQALKDLGQGPTADPAPMMNRVIDNSARIAFENARRAEEDRKKQQAQEELQRQQRLAAEQFEQAKKERLEQQKKAAQEKAKAEEEQRQKLQQQQASLAQDAAKTRAEFEAKRQSLLDMQQKQLAQQGTPILTMSKRALPVLPEVKQKVDEMLETIKNRKAGQWITLKRPNEQIHMSPALDFFEAADKLFLSQAKEIKTLEQFDRVMNEHHNKMWEIYDLDKAQRERLHQEWIRREEILAAQQREAVRQQQMLEQAQPQRQRAYAYR